MNAVARRLIIVGVILASGTAAGLALGNFAAGPESFSGRGMNETDLIGLDASLVPPEGNVTGGVTGGREFAAQPGPSSYNCVGCDAHPYNEMTPADSGAIDIAPLPPYRSEDKALPVGTGPVDAAGSATSVLPPSAPVREQRQAVPPLKVPGE